ncbi:transcriptional regulator [Streptomyces echinoruber]|uniref:Transcriptional regulator n=1 Tax=Streptomyces echinoruber TaxID=68898 RepID=A0A918RQN6_9ACTN|nr:LCP family protein [Streptomyces echinoruber]GHA09366.1 transcriptional regulator [Streptomyces echinoruber]
MEHDTEVSPSHRGETGRGRRGRRLRRLRRAAVYGLLVLAVAGCGAGYWLYSSLEKNIKGIAIDKALGDDRPSRQPAAGQNILVLGSDSRAGANAALKTGTVSGARSDTALVIHVAQDRKKAVAVSIPRDTLVTRPRCTGPDGTEVAPAQRVMFNSVYSQGGPACVVKTVEHMSRVRIDHYVEIDFSGFKELVDAMGGVTVTVDRDIHDSFSGLDLTAGTHRLNGIQSLRFVRTRHGIGDGSDLGRIRLQQQFVLALLNEVKKQKLLENPAKAYRIADSLTAALTTDSGLASLTGLMEFGRSMSEVDPSAVEMIMLPVVYDKHDPNRVVPAEPQATALWKTIRTDAPVPASAKKPR